MKNNRFIFINIAYIGALIALQVVLGNLVQIAMLTKQMNFGFLPIAVGGYLFGPVGGLLVAALGDVVGTVLFGTGAYFPGLYGYSRIGRRRIRMDFIPQIPPVGKRMLQKQSGRIAHSGCHRLCCRGDYLHPAELLLAHFLYWKRLLGYTARTPAVLSG